MGGFAAAARDWDDDEAEEVVHLRLVAAGEPTGPPAEAVVREVAGVVRIDASSEDVIFAW